MNRPNPGLLGAFVVLGFLLVTAANTARADRRAAEPRKAELIRLIETRRSQVADLDAAVSELRGQVLTAERRAARESAAAASSSEQSTRLAIQAGTIALRGNGLRVRLADADKPGATPDEQGAGRIHDVDIQLVVNALFASGAEAIAINDSRVVATTAIRSAGDTVVVNFRPLRPPYLVEAIGADLSAFNASPIVQRFRQWAQLFGLSFSATRAERLTVPAYTGRVAIGTARPVSG